MPEHGAVVVSVFRRQAKTVRSSRGRSGNPDLPARVVLRFGNDFELGVDEPKSLHLNTGDEVAVPMNGLPGHATQIGKMRLVGE